MSMSGRGAKPSRMNALNGQPRSASWAAMAAAMGSVTRSVMSVTLSSAWMRRQVKTAERAPGMNSGG
jgi:hypothetical protein